MQTLIPWTEGSTEIPNSRYRNLWLSVLHMATEDAEGHFISVGGLGHHEVQRMAIAWLIRGGDDFKLVCTLAGIDWTWALREFRRRFGTKENRGWKRERVVRKRQRSLKTTSRETWRGATEW